MSRMTEEQKKFWMTNTDSRCPFCHSEDTDSGKMQVDGPTAWMNWSCNECYEEWTEYFALVDVSERP